VWLSDHPRDLPRHPVRQRTGSRRRLRRLGAARGHACLGAARGSARAGSGHPWPTEPPHALARPTADVVETVVMRPPAVIIRRDSGLFGYERALTRRGLGPVAGVDEAGRGACAGPLVVAAAILDPRRTGRLTALADSKLLTERTRERV